MKIYLFDFGTIISTETRLMPALQALFDSKLIVTIDNIEVFDYRTKQEDKPKVTTHKVTVSESAKQELIDKHGLSDDDFIKTHGKAWGKWQDGNEEV